MVDSKFSVTDTHFKVSAVGQLIKFDVVVSEIWFDYRLHEKNKNKKNNRYLDSIIMNNYKK